MTTPIGPSFIALQVRDLAASADYYSDIFGFAVGEQNPPGAVVFDTKPIALALRTPLRELPKSGPLGTGIVLWIACKDADALHDRLVTRDANILAAPADGPFGRFFVVADPDGYALTFHTARP